MSLKKLLLSKWFAITLLSLLFIEPFVALSASLDVDKNGTSDATDGVLILRHMSGASTIDTGVILPPEQTNSTVMSTINALGSMLDVDKNGTVDATDGVLILRRLNGADTIDTGVVLSGCNNHASIILNIDQLIENRTKIIHIPILINKVAVNPDSTTISEACANDTDYSKLISSLSINWQFNTTENNQKDMGSGKYSFNIKDNKLILDVENGWAGVWTHLVHQPMPWIKDDLLFVSGVEVHVSKGNGRLDIELKDFSGVNLLKNPVSFDISTNSPIVLTANLSANISFQKIKTLNWLIQSAGNVVVDRVDLKVDSSFSDPKTWFLYTYTHLSQSYDPSTGLTRDRTDWSNLASVQTMGMFALATVLAWKQGFVEEDEARKIVRTIKATLIELAKHESYYGVLPHVLLDGKIKKDSEYSTVDSVITLIAAILANQALGEETASLEQVIEKMDWYDLTRSEDLANPVSHGYNEFGDIITTTWDTFGSESFLVALAMASATGKVMSQPYRARPSGTRDGSGFNDELAALFFPMLSEDVCGNSWQEHRTDAVKKQRQFPETGQCLKTELSPFKMTFKMNRCLGFFGMSASEVPEPWAVHPDLVYGAWGGGGWNSPKDGVCLVGYPFIAPHYMAMISADHPKDFAALFTFLSKNQLFTPWRNVESIGLDSQGVVHWNGLKGAWNLSMQLLGIARGIDPNNYLPYTMFRANPFLSKGYDLLMPKTAFH